MSKVNQRDIDSLFAVSDNATPAVSASQPNLTAPSTNSRTAHSTAVLQDNNNNDGAQQQQQHHHHHHPSQQQEKDMFEGLLTSSGTNLATTTTSEASLRSEGSPFGSARAGSSSTTAGRYNASTSHLFEAAVDHTGRAGKIKKFRISKRDSFSMSVFGPETPVMQRSSSQSQLSQSSPPEGGGGGGGTAAAGERSVSPSSPSPSPQKHSSSHPPSSETSRDDLTKLHQQQQQQQHHPSSPSQSATSATAPKAIATLSSSTATAAQQIQQQSEKRAAIMTAPIVQIPVPGLLDIFDEVISAKDADADKSHLPVQQNVKLIIAPREHLPTAFDMPARLRCDFCMKYDSLCFNCHRRWREVEQPQRRTAVLARFADIPEGPRLAIFFATCARGTAEFVKLVCDKWPTAVKWVSELKPTKFDLAMDEEDDIHDAWDDMLLKPGTVDMESLPPPVRLRPGLLRFVGRHTALHIAVAYDNREVGKVLLDKSTSLVRSERRLMAFQLLPELVVPAAPSAAATSTSSAKQKDDDTNNNNNSPPSSTSSPQQNTTTHVDPAKDMNREEQKDDDNKNDADNSNGDATTTNSNQVNNKHSTSGDDAGLSAEQCKDDYVPASLREPEEEKPLTHDDKVRLWHELFNSKPAMEELIMANKARYYRVVNKFDEADAVYEQLLKRNPRHEHGLCGRAKMMFDQGKFDECIRQCRDILSLDMFGGVQWIDFDTATVQYLMESALKVIHDRAHAIRGSTLKGCGCVFTDHMRLPLLTHMKQGMFLKHVVPFIDVQCAFAVVRAFTQSVKRAKSRTGVVGRGVARALQQAVTLLPVQVLTPLLYANPELATVLNQLRQHVPKQNAAKYLPPYASRGFSVVAFCDFDKIMVRAIVEAVNPAFKKGFTFFKQKTAETVAVVKEFEICEHVHPDTGARSWELVPSSEWEVDESIVMTPAVVNTSSDKKK